MARLVTAIGEVMIQRIYPQEEERWYLTDSKYLLILLRKKDPAANGVIPSEFARNIWLIEDKHELWRIHTDEDHNGYPFSALNQRDVEYVAFRDSFMGENNTTWRINMSTGQGTLVPAEEARYPRPGGPTPFIKTEKRIYLPDHSYLVLPLFYNSNDESRNITRVSEDGKQIWRVKSSIPKMNRDPTFIFDDIYIHNDGRFVAALDERVQFELDVDTGIATPTRFPSE